MSETKKPVDPKLVTDVAELISQPKKLTTEQGIDLQHKLRQMGYQYNHEYDGKIGGHTSESIMNFISDNPKYLRTVNPGIMQEMVYDGQLGNLMEVAGKDKAGMGARIEGLLKKNHNNLNAFNIEDSYHLQTYLAVVGYGHRNGIDGEIGPKTRESFAKFEADWKLPGAKSKLDGLSVGNSFTGAAAPAVPDVKREPAATPPALAPKRNF